MDQNNKIPRLQLFQHLKGVIWMLAAGWLAAVTIEKVKMKNIQNYFIFHLTFHFDFDFIPIEIVFTTTWNPHRLGVWGLYN